MPRGRADHRVDSLGGLWRAFGAACLVPRLPGVLGWVLFGAIIVTLVQLVRCVFPESRRPLASTTCVVWLVYAFWGFGLWLIAQLLRAALGWR